ncbi:MAG: glutamate-1-semialdehyde 2,1-aminomutase [Candidatus Dormibacteraeota bacterium]|nr:glutamate-1-semialdehyde 2,1-aminomutase [Candidatus Dormibacteraeota bacterium]
MTEESQAFLEEARARFPGGVQSPVRAYAAVGGDPPVPVRGEGAHVWDLEGREYVDWVCAYGPLIAGHAHPDVVRAIAGAAHLGGPFGATVEGELRLARLIQRRMPSVERIRFVNSGTEAAMSALRVARAATGRDLVLKFEGGYHGHADHLLASAGSGIATLGLPGSAGVPAAIAAQTLVVPRALAAAQEAARAHAGEVAAIIVEPVGANVGVVPPEPGFLEGLRALSSELGALLIFDEVITGFRVAPGGAQERYGVKPDLTVLGKIIGGGLPVGAYGGRADLMDLVAPLGPVYQAGTLSGHPLVMAAGEATLRLLDDAAYARLETLGEALEEGLQPYGRVARVGSLVTLFLDGGSFPELHARLRRGGVLIPPSPYEAWFISLAHTESDIERTVEALR